MVEKASQSDIQGFGLSNSAEVKVLHVTEDEEDQELIVQKKTRQANGGSGVGNLEKMVSSDQEKTGIRQIRIRFLPLKLCDIAMPTKTLYICC